MFEYMESINLTPARAYTKRKITTAIVLHHFASDATVQSVHEYHISKGNKGIDYNVVVLLDGRVIEGRGLAYEGGHTQAKYGYNARSIGIACQGNFEVREMPEVQKASLLRLVQDCLAAYPTITEITPHKDISATSCPGRYYPLAEVQSLLGAATDNKQIIKGLQAALNAAAGAKLAVDGIVGAKTTAAVKQNLLRYRPWKTKTKGAYVKWVQQRLLAKGYSVGASGADGVYGKNTADAVREYQQDAQLTADGIVGINTVMALVE